MDRQQIDFKSFLPAIYQAEPNVPDPAQTLVGIFASLLESVEYGLNRVPHCLDPEWACDEPGDDDHDFLGWLARWVALDPDEDLPSPIGNDRALFEDNERRRRELVGSAAKLYRKRGTVRGLQYLLETFCDVDTDIREWTWPSGMQIGVTSSIGTDTFLTDRPDRWTCFTVVWRTRSLETAKDAPGVQWFETVYGGDIGDGPNLTGIADSGVPLAGNGFGVRLSHIRRVLDRVRRVLDREKPAHTSVYIAVRPVEWAPVERPPVDAMIIGISSTIGMFCIEWAGESERN
jgi:phage tail-like protein